MKAKDIYKTVLCLYKNRRKGTKEWEKWFRCNLLYLKTLKFQIIGGNVVIRYFLLEFNVVAVFGALGKWGKMSQLLAYLFIIQGNRKERGRKENP